MAVNLSPVGGVAAQFFNNNGVILTGGKIYTYTAGTSTPQVTYTSSSGTTAHSNPIILDASGRVPSGEIWLTDGLSYKFVIKDSNDVLIGTYDNVIGINSNFVNFTNQQEIQTATAGQTVFTLTTTQYQPGTNSLTVFVDGVNQYGSGAQYAYVETSSTVITFVTGLHVGASVKFTTSQINSSAATSADQVSYTPAGTGAVVTNVQAKLRETVSVKDFGAVGDGVADDTVAIQAAHNTGKVIYYPEGEYKFSSTINIALGGIVGSGLGITYLVSTDTSTNNLINYTGTTAGYFSGFQLQAPLAKTAGAGIEVVTATSDNAYSVFENVNFYQLPVGISFTKARLFKILACNFIAYTVAGCLVANTSNNDAGDSVISDSTFFGGAPTAHGVVQYSSGGLKIVGNKFNDGATAYYLNYTVTSATSIVIIDGNSIENMVSAAIALQSSVASAFTFNFVVVSNNEIAICANGITTDATGFISEMTVTGNVINVSASGTAISLNKVSNFNIVGNTLNGPGGTIGINLDTCTNGKIGINTYSVATPYAIFTSTVSVQKDDQTGSVTTGLASNALGALYNSAATTVTFPTAFKVAPSKSDISLIAEAATGAIGGTVLSTSTTNFVFYAISTNNSVAPVINWKASGTM